MHFSIPDTREIKDKSGSSFVAYNIHVNGAYHCTVRYRQLHNLFDQLRREYGPHKMPPFPPKKLLPLTPAQIEERRAQLEKFIQLVSQDGRIAHGDMFSGFLLSAQQETQNVSDEMINLEVRLMNWQKVVVNMSCLVRTSVVLEAVAKSLKLDEKYASNFCIYLVSKCNNEISVERRLQDYESAYLSLKSAGIDHHLVVRKSYWDPQYEDELAEDRICLNLLYVQAVSDVEQGWTKTDVETRRRLATLQARGSKKEYLQLARTLPFYGHIKFRRCVCDYPRPGTEVTPSIGGREFILRFDSDPNSENCVSFRVVRIKCWRITTSLADRSENEMNGETPAKLKLELSFEYLMNKVDLKWICIHSDQAILMSSCLQGIVDELLQKQGNKSEEPMPSERTRRRGSWNYMKRDGSSHQICSSVGRSVSTDAIAHSLRSHIEREDSSNILGKSKGQVRKFSGKLSGLSSKHAGKNGPMSPKPLVENDAFEGIGDDDL